MRFVAALCVVAVVALSSCSSNESGGRSAPSSTVESSTTTGDDPTPNPDAFDADFARVLVVDWLNGVEVSEAEYRGTFDRAFRKTVPYATFQSLLASLSAGAPWEQSDVLEDRPTSTVFRVRSEIDGEVVVSLVVDPASGEFTGLLFEPYEFDRPDSIDEAVRRLRAQGTVRLLMSDVSDGSCAPTLDERSTEAMPIGSVFKLYVLGAVVAAVDAGTTTWDAPVTIDEALDSLPSGETQNLEPGTRRTVRELAEVMISVSDNTAADHLIDHVGRDAVEAVLEPMGNDAVARNQPFLTTRELFILKWGPPRLGPRYVEADEAGRRAVLAEEVAGEPLPPFEAFVSQAPVLVNDLEWFASPVALCRALLVLASDATASEILAANPGVPEDGSRWSRILFKGGSEPGVVAVSWLTNAPDGTVRATTGSVVNTEEAVDETEVVQLFGFIRDARSPS